MIRSPEELTKPIKEAVSRQTVLIAHLLLVGTVALHIALNPSSKTYQIILSLILCAGLAALLVFARLLDLQNVNKKPHAYIVAYHIVFFLCFAFLSGPSSTYAIVAFLVVFISNLYYGSKGVKYAVGAFAATSIVKFIYETVAKSATTGDKLNIIATLLVFVAVALIFINIQKISEWDRERLRETIKEEVVEQKRLRALVNNMTETVLVLDREGIIRLYNAAALALFNTNSSLSDKPMDGFVKLEDEKGKIITTADLLPKDSKPIVRSDVKVRYSKDDSASLSIVSTPIRPTFGQEHNDEGYVITMRDITREKSLEEERDEFISVISHELRTPVTVAEAGVSNALLLSAKLPGNEKITKSLQTAHDQAVFLANMLNDLATFARAEKGTLETNLEEFDPRDLLEALKKDYHGAVESKHMNLITAADPSTPAKMASNRLYIREILQNFITNAIKYSDKGTITISCRAKNEGILFTVADEGIGISVSDQKKLFQKFFRAEDYRTRSTNGTGLGLYIVKKLAKILDATFEVQSEVGKGSSFSIYVPDKSDFLAAKKATDSVPVPTTHQTPTPMPAVPSNGVPTPAPAPVPPVVQQVAAANQPSVVAPVMPTATPESASALPKQG